MSLGVKQSKTYLNIREGKILSRDKEGKELLYDYVEGTLAEITTKEREFKGEVVKYCYIDLHDRSGVVYSLGLHYSSGVAKSLFNSLASVEDYSKTIRIEPYLSGDFTKVVVYSGGIKLAWKYPELPPVEEIQVRGKTVKDDSKRMEFFEGLVKQINAKI
jgi:hypothetical protein